MQVKDGFFIFKKEDWKKFRYTLTACDCKYEIWRLCGFNEDVRRA